MRKLRVCKLVWSAYADFDKRVWMGLLAYVDYMYESENVNEKKKKKKNRKKR